MKLQPQTTMYIVIDDKLVMNFKQSKIASKFFLTMKLMQ